MKSFYYLLLLIALGCSSPGNESKKELVFHTTEFSAESCEDEKCAKVFVSYPVAAETEVGKRINDEVMNHLMVYFRQDTVFADLKTASDDFIQSYEEFKKDFPDAPGEWFNTINATKTYESDSLVSIEFSSSDFSGGAHPNSSVNYLIFSKTKGELLSKDQFILDQDKLLEKTRIAFREFHDIPMGVTIAEDDRFFIPETGFFLPSAMGYEGDTFYLTYNPYEIGPYALGYTDLEIPLSELNGIVRK
ncbi:DUF3298 and DUF4163 domain-containing protein [Algoriphagus machipongonensis]|uniref:Uncharacterized protein n=1 Tax=Algoriphagus machipongonensis TaxID=388413 RepID=A3HWN4_9BACT|nr:DUF4163 domain-containing protein [Algoriphagus machipongonensis]EAZ81007.1 hypothetical protein ALPR1_18263 [Algoriphagus machipongonensis]